MVTDALVTELVTGTPWHTGHCDGAQGRTFSRVLSHHNRQQGAWAWKGKQGWTCQEAPWGFSRCAPHSGRGLPEKARCEPQSLSLWSLTRRRARSLDSCAELSSFPCGQFRCRHGDTSLTHFSFWLRKGLGKENEIKRNITEPWVVWLVRRPSSHASNYTCTALSRPEGVRAEWPWFWKVRSELASWVGYLTTLCFSFLSFTGENQHYLPHRAVRVRRRASDLQPGLMQELLHKCFSLLWPAN